MHCAAKFPFFHSLIIFVVDSTLIELVFYDILINSFIEILLIVDFGHM